MYRDLLVNYQYIIPTSTKMNHGKECKIYDFYHDGGFNDYLKDEKVHPVNKERAYGNFENYMVEHWTKETDSEAYNHIKTFNNVPKKATGKADNTIIYHCIMSIGPESSKMGGFCNDKVKKSMCDYLFTQFMKHHRYDPKDWCYEAAEHTNTANTHMHVLIYQPNTVKPERIADWHNKDNIYTSRWVKTMTTRYASATVPSLSKEALCIIDEIYKLHWLSPKVLKDNKEYCDTIVSIGRDIDALAYNANFNYKYIESKAFSLEPDPYKGSLDGKNGELTKTNATVIHSKINSAVNYILESDANIAKQYQAVKEKVYSLDFKHKLQNDLLWNKFDKFFRQTIAETILKAIMDNICVDLYMLSSKYRKIYKYLPIEKQDPKYRCPKDCRTYKHLMNNTILYALRVARSSVIKAIEASRKSGVKDFADQLIEQEQRMKNAVQSGKIDEKDEERIEKKGFQLC